MDEILGLLPDPLLDQACRGLRSLLAGLRLEVAEGDLQWVQPTRLPDKPFVVKATAGEPAGPTEGLSIRFVHRETGRRLGDAVTDAAGLASWTMTSALPAEPTSGAVVAQLDLDGAYRQRGAEEQHRQRREDLQVYLSYEGYTFEGRRVDGKDFDRNRRPRRGHWRLPRR